MITAEQVEVQFIHQELDKILDYDLIWDEKWSSKL